MSAFDRLRGVSEPRLDLVLAAAILLEIELEAWLDDGIPDTRRAATAIAAVLFVAPLGFRRRWPAAALIACAAVATVGQLLGGRLGQTSGLGMMLALVLLGYCAGACLEWRPAVAALIVAIAAFSGFVFDSRPTVAGGIGTALFFAALVFVAPWTLGRITRERHQRGVAFHELAVRAVAEREQRNRAAVSHERLRIGGELQDIVAQSVGAMVIGAGAARQLLYDDPERARESILAVERTGREALANLRRLLGILRKDDDPRALTPQPGLDQLPELVDAARQGGLACRLHAEPAPARLTPGIDLVGFRVIEAALRAAEPHCREAEISVRYGPHQLELEVRGDGSIPDLEGELRGIVERIQLYHGTVEVHAADGFALRARLPLGAAVAA